MSFPGPIIKLSFGGSVQGQDIWSNSFHLIDYFNENTQELFNSLEPEDFITIANTFYTAAPNGMNQFNTLETIKLALIGADGKYMTDPKIYDYPTPRLGSGQYAVSPQDSIVVSLLTPVKRGLAYRGRFFPPAGFAAPSGSGRLSSASVNSMINKAVLFLRGIDNIAASATEEADGKLVVASSTRSGAYWPVTAVEVGNIMDNQKRRRNRLNEVYESAPLNP